MSRTAKVERWKAKNGKWYFHRRATNGKITDPSQGYSTKSNATRAIRNDPKLAGLPIVDLTRVD